MKLIAGLLFLIPTLGWANIPLTIKLPGEFELTVAVLNKPAVEQQLREPGTAVDPALYLPYTARTHRLPDSTCLVELYDGQGLLLNDPSAIETLARVHFIKNQIWYLNPRITYYIPIDRAQVEKLLAALDLQEMSEYGRKYDEHWQIEVFELANGQVLYTAEEQHWLYEDLEALVMHQPHYAEVRYPEGPESGRKAFVAGEISTEFSIRNFLVFREEAEAVIANHGLSPLLDSIQFDFQFHSTLYQATDGYLVLMNDFEQLNVAGTGKIGIGDAIIFDTRSEFDSAYAHIKAWHQQIQDDPSFSQGKHIYADFSEKYGRHFPKHALEEISLLPQLLNFDSARLAFTPDCAAIISESILWNYHQGEFMERTFMPLLAYVGEYYRSRWLGDWDMRAEGRNKVWVPWLVDTEGNPRFDSHYFYTDFYEAEYGIPPLAFYLPD